MCCQPFLADPSLRRRGTAAASRPNSVSFRPKAASGGAMTPDIIRTMKRTVKASVQTTRTRQACRASCLGGKWKPCPRSACWRRIHPAGAVLTRIGVPAFKCQKRRFSFFGLQVSHRGTSIRSLVRSAPRDGEGMAGLARLEWVRRPNKRNSRNRLIDLGKFFIVSFLRCRHNAAATQTGKAGCGPKGWFFNKQTPISVGA